MLVSLLYPDQYPNNHMNILIGNGNFKFFSPGRLFFKNLRISLKKEDPSQFILIYIVYLLSI